MKEGTKFQVGDVVRWKSSANGTTKSKSGEIVLVIPANVQAQTPVKAFLKQNPRFNGANILAYLVKPRDHESYIVATPKGKRGGKQKLYHPLVNKLDLIFSPSEVYGIKL